VVTELSEVVGRIWGWEARGVYLAVTWHLTVEPDCEPGFVLAILHADRLDAADHAWIDAHHECVLASVVALRQVTVQ
jgi:hypothetical protein